MEKEIKKPVKVITVKKEESEEVKTLEVAVPEMVESPAELKRQIEELRQKLNAEPRDIEERIAFYKEKQELIRKRDVLFTQLGTLGEHKEILNQSAEADEFSIENYSLNLSGKVNYREESFVVIRNPVLLCEVLEFVMLKMRTKVELLDAKIAC